MPEITSVEAVREKLRQFDEMVTGAIGAAEALARLKTRADDILSSISERYEISTGCLKDIEDKVSLLREFENCWHDLRGRVEATLVQSNDAQATLMDQVSSAIAGLGAEVARAEGRISEASEAASVRHEETIRELDGKTRESADRAEEARNTAVQNADKVSDLLVNVQSDLRDMTESESRALERRLTAAFVERFDSAVFQLDAKLAEHEERLDRRMTEFLIKQNALIQNLSQHAESYERISAGLKTTLTTVTTQTDVLQKSLADTKIFLGAVQSDVIRSRRDFEALLEKLAQLPFVGKNFKS